MACQVGAGKADIVDIHQLADRRTLHRFVQQQFEIPSARKRHGFSAAPARSRARIFAVPEFVRQIAAAGLQRGFYRPHQIVLGTTFCAP